MNLMETQMQGCYRSGCPHPHGKDRADDLVHGYPVQGYRPPLYIYNIYIYIYMGRLFSFIISKTELWSHFLCQILKEEQVSPDEPAPS